ncbi:hypothetical protein [Streptacidiphilus cavernicola]|uniref:Uncharacterized protein n=1 Tax=Streptacidiphilus cavernicola TaxID=3342716 RepID=A0ABV6VXS6_9ACTN
MQSAEAVALTPAQATAAEQAAAATRVPFDLPLSGAVQSVTGDASPAGLHGSMPGLPIVPPDTTGSAGDSLLPDPLVPPLTAADRSPDLSLVAPLVGGDGAVREDGLAATLPSAPVDARGVAATLGHPVIWSKQDPQAEPQIDLDRLAPALTTPRVESSPTGYITLDQRTTNRPLTRTVSEFLATTTATAQDLSNQ